MSNHKTYTLEGVRAAAREAAARTAAEQGFPPVITDRPTLLKVSAVLKAEEPEA